ncbi:helix-turn-helix domain-containing protein [Brevundimonas diminuta]|uniref:helix-turn-helix domain-containing protein n=1 Tax=Brevundimonas diminuta TaxID=293 RepID=UPI0030FCE610
MLIYTPRDLGAAIRERRKALGLDQVELAKQIGASRRWLIQVENGKAGASFGMLLRTLNALGMQLDLKTPSAAPTSPQEPLSTPDLDSVLARARRGAASE